MKPIIHEKFMFGLPNRTGPMLVWVIKMAKILLIEDDELVRHMYLQVLMRHGHKTAPANNGVGGLARVQAFSPDLILLNVMMPKTSCLEMLRRLKNMPGLGSIPVIALTNLMGAGNARACLEAGAVRYLIKSDYTPEEIATIVDDVLRECRAKPRVTS